MTSAHSLPPFPARLRRRSKTTPAFNQSVVLGVIFVLCFCHLMLPLERGFKSFHVDRYAIPYSLIISLLTFGSLTIISNKAIFKNWRGFYVWGQCLLSLIMFISALRSEIPLASIAISMQYFCIWVLNYLSIRFLLESNYRETFVKVLCFVAMMAAIVGIIEGAFTIRIPIYQIWVRSYFGEGSRLDLLQGFDRATGTLGQHHIYSTAILLMIPFACELKNRWLRIGLVTLLVAASLLTVSRTVLVFLGIYLVGYLLISRKKNWFLLPGLLCSFLMISNIDITQFSDSAFVSLWGQRLNLIKGAENRYADQNVSGRYDMWSRAANAFLDQNAVDEIIGSGMLSSAEIAQSQNITTLDNTYLTILYEQGIAGIFIFLFVFATLLWRLRFFAQFSLHWYGILALLVVGQTFVTQGYSTFNFIAVSSIALMLSFRTHKSTQ